MKMNFGKKLEIRDLGNHRAVEVITLGIVLAGTVEVTPDPKRKGFYEVVGRSRVYYICVSPVSGIIFLLGTWRKVVPPVPQLGLAVRHHSKLREVELSSK
jgi:hypothetical protein